MIEVLCVDALGTTGITVGRTYLVETHTDLNYIIYNDLHQTSGYLKKRFFISRDVPDAAEPEPTASQPKETAEHRFREALERIAKLTPGAANASNARDLHLTVKAIAECALADHPAER